MRHFCILTLFFFNFKNNIKVNKLYYYTIVGVFKFYTKIITTINIQNIKRDSQNTL